jgi:hypothetical protein
MAKIHGARELRAAIRRAPQDLRDEAIKEVKASTDQMHRRVMELLASASKFAPLWHGKPGMQNITGAARRNYRKSVSKAKMQGRVGLLTSGAERAAFHLRFFFYGTSHQPARPAHDEAFEAERDVFIERQTKALANVLRRMG